MEMSNLRGIFLLVAVLLPYYIAVFGRPMPEGISMETVVVSNVEISVEDDGKIEVVEQIDEEGWVFISEEELPLEGQVVDLDKVEEIVMGPTYVVVPSKGDITGVLPPNTTTPAPDHLHPIFRPLKSPQGGVLGGFLSFLLAVVYLLISLGLCMAICILMIICTCLFENWRMPVPRNAPPVQQINRIPAPVVINRARDTGRAHSQVRSKSKTHIIVVRGAVKLGEQQQV